jgi:hypothetical protein
MFKCYAVLRIYNPGQHGALSRYHSWAKKVNGVVIEVFARGEVLLDTFIAFIVFEMHYKYPGILERR